MTASETFKDFVVKQMEAAGYTLLPVEPPNGSDALVLPFYVKGHEYALLHIVSSGRELRMNENTIEALAKHKIHNAIRSLESNEPVVAAAAKARAAA